MMHKASENLQTAIEKGRTDIVRTIIEACQKCEVEEDGKDLTVEALLNTPSTAVGTLLHLATKLDLTDIVRTLLAAGADPGVHNDEGQTAFDMATSPNVCDVYNGELLQAVASSNVRRVTQLLSAGVEVNLLDSPDSRNTPLHWAVTYGNKDVVNCLCKHKAKIDATNSDGATALHDAITRGNMDIIEELIKAGASTTIRATNGKWSGRTVQDLAIDMADLKSLLDKYNKQNLETSPGEPLMNGSVVMDDNLSDSDGPNASNGHVNDSDAFIPGTSGSYTGKMSDLLVVSPSTSQSEPVPLKDKRLSLLWPSPQKITQGEGSPFFPKDTLPIYLSNNTNDDTDLTYISHEMGDIWWAYSGSLRDIELELEMNPIMSTNLLLSDNPHVVCEVNKRLFSRDESYRIHITEKQTKVQASDIHGLFHGVNTFMQLMVLCQEGGIPHLQIHDWPSLRDRGVLLDLSKGRIPTMDSLRNIIIVLASLKVNQVQLYMRFKSKTDDEDTWQLPYPQTAMLAMDRLLRDLHMKVVPVIDVIPSVTYDQLQSLREAFHQFIYVFPSASTVGIGPRLTSLLVEITESGDLKTEDIVRLIPIKSQQTAQLCGFVLHDNPKCLQQFPFNMSLVEYGFQASYQFETHCKQYSDNGVPFSVMPGTAAWNSVAGCPEAAVTNIYTAVQAAIKHGALGLIVAHWAGVGHITHQTMAWPGLLTAAGLGWNSNIDWDFLNSNLADLINRHVLQDSANVLGQCVIELGRAETYVVRSALNMTAQKLNFTKGHIITGPDVSHLPAEKGSTLYQLLSNPDQVTLEHLTAEVFQRTMRHIRKCQTELNKATPQCPEGSEIIAELQLTADLMMSAARVGRTLISVGKNPSSGLTGLAVINLGVANLPSVQKTDLANRLLAQIDNYRRIWTSRNLQQGLQDSIQLVSAMLQQLLPDMDPAELQQEDTSTTPLLTPEFSN